MQCSFGFEQYCLYSCLTGDGVNLFIEANNFPSSGLDRVQLVGVDGSELSAFTVGSTGSVTVLYFGVGHA